MTFAHPYYFLLLLLLIPAILWYVLKRKQRFASLQVSNTFAFKQMPKTWKQRCQHLPFVLRCLVFSLVVVVLARPQSVDSWQNTSTEGIDIVVALDISTSMLAEDLKPNRLEAAKSIASSFVADRHNDNIGLVLFAGESFTQCPLTTDHAVLMNLFGSIQCGMIEDGTAIGLGLANAVSRVKDSQAKSKVIILLTDGTNNRGDIDPLTAAELAKTFGIRVYTIGVGKKGKAPYPFQTANGVVYQNVEVNIDEEPLKQIASLTGGVYFRATDNATLAGIYQEIDQLEKTKMQVREYSKRQEEFRPFALAAFLLLLIEIMLRQIIRSLP
ncbi:MAG: VWA domain-containing protein [Bacteroidales bacterium]|nr:VWA domain-containing protein [Bacteroidales bacterium]MBO5768952.1 VWA domain-containing protein [Bacteroidales bacterium]MBO5845939.1 VWA domain-containing protein [Bacteroidales bacterium]